ncbi:MAG: hypothetical protein JXX29_10630 [Deltaproteobacteria bacterium]|nr:hypothetical protein [Deltaproteobacteria bacterium]MBN2672123.1 hypothetical protein [Deltaproteobacteria bacterium]
MLQFRLTEKARKLFRFRAENLSEPVESDAFLGNWYVNIFRLGGDHTIIFMSEKTCLSFVLLNVREDHAEVLGNAFVNGLDHLLDEEKFSERSKRRIFEGIDMMELAKTTNRSLLAKMSAIEALYLRLVERAGGLHQCDILEIMKRVNRFPSAKLDYLSPLKATKKLLRNSDEQLH